MTSPSEYLLGLSYQFAYRPPIAPGFATGVRREAHAIARMDHLSYYVNNWPKILETYGLTSEALSSSK